jgi:hypothetical protein
MSAKEAMKEITQTLEIFSQDESQDIQSVW